jgi:ATP-dependent Clp protease ATP-binding subunit ClpA
MALSHDYVGTEHILLGVARENEGVAARILLEFDVDSEKIRADVVRMLAAGGGEPLSPPSERGDRVHMYADEDPSRVWIGGPPSAHAQVPLSDAAQAVLGRAAMEALANERARVAARDLLVGLMASDTPLGAALTALVESDASAAKTLRGILEQAGPVPGLTPHIAAIRRRQDPSNPPDPVGRLSHVPSSYPIAHPNGVFCRRGW